ncbi:MAG: enoyl-CoA hydratase/isomerase family protein [Anaerolineae bacterium]|jgi:enoyl-CoA hydratase/carnithine racemase|nr:enoyl-CoA hydratase/isomerase family protein [Anaerolineae bacterium]
MSLVTITREGHTVHIALNRADKRNALSHSVLTALDSAFDEAERLATQDPAGVRAVVLRGEGPSFCAGIDLSGFEEVSGVFGEKWRENLFSMTARYQQILNKVEACALPVVGLLHGVCIGFGMELALACDFRIAAEGTRLQLPETRLGIIPDVGGTSRLVRALGQPRAKEYIMTGKPFDLADAERWGMVNRVVAPDQLASAGAQMVAELAQAAPLAVRFAKKVIDGAGDLQRGLTLEGWAQSVLMHSEDFGRGAMAALTKQAPEWSGQ